MKKKKSVVTRAAALVAVFMMAVTSVMILAPQSQAASVSATYMTYDQVEGKWLPTVVNNSDYAGNYGNGVSGVAIELSGGYQVTYDVHQINGNRWLPAVTGFSTTNTSNGFAGNLGSNTIDALMVKTNAPVQVEYRVHIKGGGWLPGVTGYNTADANNGYAGNIGQAIDAIQIWFPGTTTSSTSSTISTLSATNSSKIIAAAQTVVAAKIPYVWGGGHGAKPGPTTGSYEPTSVTHSTTTSNNYWAHDKVTQGLDCSGYVRYAYYKATGIDLGSGFVAATPETSSQWQKVSQANAKAGDVVVLSGGQHIGIYDGNGKIYEEPGHTVPTTWGYAIHSNAVSHYSVVGFYHYKGL